MATAQDAPTVVEEVVHGRDELKELKVRIRISQHIQLHRIRLLTERTISETVREALDRYFDEMADSGAASGGG